MAADPDYWPKIWGKIGNIKWAGFSHEELASIKAPVLIALGDHDFVRLEHAVATFQLIPNARRLRPDALRWWCARKLRRDTALPLSWWVEKKARLDAEANRIAYDYRAGILPVLEAHLRSRLIFPLQVALGSLALCVSATAAAIVETATPNMFTVQAGGTFTLSGSINFPDAANYQYGSPTDCSGGCFDESLFGLTATAPHLGIFGGSVALSRNFSPPIGPAYFEDDFLGPAGFMGPTNQTGPTITAVTDWRQFQVPVGTLPGIYNYSYGIYYTENGNFPSRILFANNLQLDVTSTPEPASLILFISGLAAMAFRYTLFHFRWSSVKHLPTSLL